MRMLRWQGHGTGACHLSVPLCRWSLKARSACRAVRPARQALPPLARGVCTHSRERSGTSPVRGLTRVASSTGDHKGPHLPSTPHPPYTTLLANASHTRMVQYEERVGKESMRKEQIHVNGSPSHRQHARGNRSRGPCSVPERDVGDAVAR
jgi:hypothetical protein